PSTAKDPRPPVPRRVNRCIVWSLIAAVLTAVCAGAAYAQAGGETAARHLARADSAYRSGDPTRAADEYTTTLKLAPTNSRATFRLAQLERDDPDRSEQLFRRYVELEPRDPWGYMALGDELARRGRFKAALA